MNEVFKFISDSYPFWKSFDSFISTLFKYMLIYKSLYLIIGFFFTRTFKKAKNIHKYGIVVAARNEKFVIGNLLDSINKQDYPSDKLTVFVVADNCTDNTAEIARSKGAIVYERFDNDHRTKGYALEFLFNNIKKDYGIETFDGFFVFDADNLLKKNYVSKMNDAFDSGCKIITSYRNTKNFDENWISSTYALHWIRSIRTNHRARSVLRLATNIQGTGFLFSSEIVKNGWHYTSLTEDRALTADAVAQGYEITYQDAAEFYDEQPTSLKIALRQRLRWSKGHLQAFAETGPYLFINIFLGKKYIKNKWDSKNTKKGFIESIRHRIASYDTLMQLIPFVFVNLCRWIFVSLLIYPSTLYMNGINNIKLFSGSTWLAKLLNTLFFVKINVDPGIKAFLLGFIIVIWFKILYRLGSYLANCIMAVYLFIVERKRIKKMPFIKKILYTLTWPLFDIIGRYTIYVALFKKVEWKPIPHESKVTIDDLKENK